MAIHLARPTYTLDDFTADMRQLVQSHPDQQKLFELGAAYLERLIRQPDALPEQFTRPSGKGSRPNHGSYALHRSEGLFISAVVWGPGDYLQPHDHNTWGMIGVLGNAIQETRFRRIDDRSQDGHAKLIKDRTNLVKPGDVSLLVPEVDEIHEMANFSDRPTVEIHVYGKDLVGLQRRVYDLDAQTVKTFASGKFDNC